MRQSHICNGKEYATNGNYLTTCVTWLIQTSDMTHWYLGTDETESHMIECVWHMGLSFFLSFFLSLCGMCLVHTRLSYTHMSHSVSQTVTYNTLWDSACDRLCATDNTLRDCVCDRLCVTYNTLRDCVSHTSLHGTLCHRLCVLHIHTRLYETLCDRLCVTYKTLRDCVCDRLCVTYKTLWDCVSHTSLYETLCHRLCVIQPIADRVAQHLEIISKNFQFGTKRTRILMGFIIYYLVLIVNPMGRILVRWESCRNNLVILCHPICNWPYIYIRASMRLCVTDCVSHTTLYETVCVTDSVSHTTLYETLSHRLCNIRDSMRDRLCNIWDSMRDRLCNIWDSKRLLESHMLQSLCHMSHVTDSVPHVTECMWCVRAMGGEDS